MHKIDNVGIIANFVFPYICHFLLYFYHMMFVNGKLDISGCKSSTFQGSLVQFLSNGHSQNKIGNIGILSCIVKSL